MFGDAFKNEAKSKAVRCLCCGFTFEDITQSGKCGCAECYSVFYDRLLPYLKKAQYDRTTHKGKIPNTVAPSKKSRKEEIAELRALLSELIKSEKYEEAAEIRDRIKMLEEGMQ